MTDIKPHTFTLRDEHLTQLVHGSAREVIETITSKGERSVYAPTAFTQLGNSLELAVDQVKWIIEAMRRQGRSMPAIERVLGDAGLALKEGGNP